MRMMALLPNKVLVLAACFIFSAHAAELPPNPPGFRLGEIDSTNGPSASLIYSEARRSVVKAALPEFDAAMIRPGVYDASKLSIAGTEKILQSGGTIQIGSHTITNPQTNDAPVRRWHDAMVAPKTVQLTGGSVTFVTTNLISVQGVVDIEELSRAVAFRRATIPPPAMLPSTNTNESATFRAMTTPYRETPGQRAQRLWFEHGGQKGRK